MRKQLAIILAVFMALQSVYLFHPVSAVPQYASIQLTLGLGDKAKLGPYTVTFSDVSLQWDQVYITVEGPDGSVRDVLKPGQMMYYPSNDSERLLIAVKLMWIKRDTQSIILEIMSPLIKFYTNKEMTAGEELTLPEGLPQIKIKLESSSSTEAVFTVTTPYGSKYTFDVPEGDSRGISYTLDSKHVYSSYLVIEVLNATKSEAVVNIYVPRVASVDFKIIPKESPTEEQPQPAVGTTIIYSDYIYVDEILRVKYNNTEYSFKLLSVIPDVIKVEALKGNQSIGNYTLGVGDIPKVVGGTPFMLAVRSTQPEYKRAVLRVYGPIEAQVNPILRSAKVVANITAVPKKVLLGQDIVLSIGVENRGRGDAYQLNVAAPIPNGFELISMTKSWQINNLPAFTKLPMLVYVLRPTKVGKFDIGKVIVTYYDDQSLETGKMKTIYSNYLAGVEVYGIPDLTVTARAYNGTWSNYVGAKVNQTVKVQFSITASKGNPNYEFVKNATLYIVVPKGLTGKTVLKVGDIKAGETKTVTADFKVTSEGLSHIGAVLVYLDPLGNEHKLNAGNLVTVNSVPPAVIIKEVKVWPKPEELPAYVNQTLKKMDDPAPLAEEIQGVVAPYVPKKSNPWKPLTIIFLLTTILAGVMAYNYYTKLEKIQEKVLKKKQRRPGGLPKKEEDEEEIELL